jgi:hypothetical protein
MPKKISQICYILDMKVGKNKIILYSWLLIGTYQKNLAIKKNYLENLVKLGLFCMENPM